MFLSRLKQLIFKHLHVKEYIELGRWKLIQSYTLDKQDTIRNIKIDLANMDNGYCKDFYK